MNKLCFSTLMFFAFFSSSYAVESTSLTVNIISHSLKNGAGKEVDVSIIKNELERLGHTVNLCDYQIVDNIPFADINLFLAQFKREWYSQATLNWYIPNAETTTATLQDLQDFDLVLCKTRESERIFHPICKKTYYLGFTSIDHYDPLLSEMKDYSKFLHSAGQSPWKGTPAVVQAWTDHPEFQSIILPWNRNPWIWPFSFLVDWATGKASPPENIQPISQRIPHSTFIALQNECGIHLCPSETEGFGHSLMEGMSVGAVVITTNAPPMNEFINDERCLVKYEKKKRLGFATLYLINSTELANKVQELNNLSTEELKEISKKNREEYLRRSKAFKENFEQLFEKTARELYD